jgi:hypothetical protein
LGGVGGGVAQAPVCAAYGAAAVSGDTVYLPCDDGTRAIRVGPAGQISVLWHISAPATGSPVLGGAALWVLDDHAGVPWITDPDGNPIQFAQRVSPAWSRSPRSWCR